MDADAVEQIHKAIRDDGRYPPAAYEFVRDGLAFTVHAVYGDQDDHTPRHVTGRQLSDGLRRLALQRWGALAGLVLRRWNIRRTRDFGEIVFVLIQLGVLGKQESDRIEDFDNVYDFRTAFDQYETRLCDDENE